MDGLVKELCKENGIEYTEKLFREIYFRCSDLEKDNVTEILLLVLITLRNMELRH